MRWNTNFTDVEVIGNYIEALFWILVGITVAIYGPWHGRVGKKLPLMAGLVFVLFGCSDVVEAQTGAWWRPLWLLAWKGLCLILLAVFYLRYRRHRQAFESSNPKTTEAPKAE